MRLLVTVFTIAVVLAVIHEGTSSVSPNVKHPILSCFFASWSTSRASWGRYSVEDIDASLCTHVVYLNARLDEATNSIADGLADRQAEDSYRKLVDLKKINPELVVTVTIGGWDDGSQKYSKMVASAESRNTFTASVVDYLKKNKLDGLNIDWQDPATRGGVSADKRNYVLLCQELKAEFEKHGWQLTVALSARKYQLDVGYDLMELAKHVDFFYVLTVEYHGPWDGYAGHISPLYPRADEMGEQRELNINFTLSYLLSAGVPAVQLVPTITLNTRAFLRDDGATNFGGPTLPKGFKGPYSAWDGFLGYNEICEKLTKPESKWTVEWQDEHKVPYAYLDNIWFGFDDVRSITFKMDLYKSLGLGGAYVFSVDTDDFKGRCGGGKNPLLKEIWRQMIKWHPEALTENTPIVACFLEAWSVYRPSLGQFHIDDIDVSLCTHVLYCFVGMDEKTNTIISKDDDYIAGGAFERLVGLKKTNPTLVVGVTIGGWGEGVRKYSKMAERAETRKVFIDSVVAFFRQHKLDTLNFDWHHPGTRDGAIHDKRNYVLLCQELKEEFRKHGWQLTVFLSQRRHQLDVGFDLPGLLEHVDFFYLLSYDYHGHWDRFTALNAPLYARAQEKGGQKELNLNFTVTYLLSKGVPANRLVFGIPFNGRTYLLSDEAINGPGAPTMETSFQGTYTREDGFIGYYEVCELQSTGQQWTIQRHPEHRGPYMYSGNRWITYDDVTYIQEKIQWAEPLGLRGVLAWAIDLDDFNDNCGGGKYPLLTAVNRALGRIKNEEDAPAVLPAHSQRPVFGKRCSVAASRDVSVAVLDCGGQTHTLDVLMARRQSVRTGGCEANSTVPPGAVVYAECWGVTELVLSCHEDGFWRPFEETEISREDANKMEQICQPHYLNSEVCGRRPRYKPTGSTLDLQLFFSQNTLRRWPWLAGLLRDNRYACSGTIISPLYVLTAAHCVTRNQETNTETMDVRDLKIQLLEDSNKRVSVIKLHPDYRAGRGYVNDLALVKLERPLLFFGLRYPACVNFNNHVPRLEAVTFNRSHAANAFQYELVHQRFDTSCHSPLDRCSQMLSVTKNQFCGVPFNNTQRLLGGSSGGPFLQNHGSEITEEWTVAGVVSKLLSNNMCDQPYTVYTAVNTYKDWLLNVVQV